MKRMFLSVAMLLLMGVQCAWCASCDGVQEKGAAVRAESDGWTAAELAAANTAKDVAAMTVEEREVVKYVNLARLYPQRFAELEVADYYGTEATGFRARLTDYRLTLIAELMACKPCGALVFDADMLADARCLAAEQSKNGETGHKRHACSKQFNAECCDYGSATGREVAIQLLIDDGVESVGHRAALLNPAATTIGVAMTEHPVYRHCAVLDMGWGSDGTMFRVRYTKASDLTKEEHDRCFAMMTRGLERDLVEPFPSGTPVEDIKVKTSRSSTPDGGFRQVKTETRVHADGRRQIIETTTVLNLDGVGDTKRRVWVE